MILIGTHQWLIKQFSSIESLPHERGLILKLVWLVFPVWLLSLDQLSYPHVCQPDFHLIDSEEKFLLAKLKGDKRFKLFLGFRILILKRYFPPLLWRTVNLNKSPFIISLFSRFCYKEICGLRKNMFRFTNSIFPRYLLQSSNKNLNLIQQSIKLISLNSVQPKIKTNNIISAFHIIHRYKIWQ